MLNELNNRLAIVSENIAQLEGQFGEYFRPECCKCVVQDQEVFLEYQHDLMFEEASGQAEALLRFFSIPTISGDTRNLLIDVSGKGATTKFHLDLSCTDDDLLLQYLCFELLSFFQKIASKS
ncbi:hypothetical protein ACPV3U_12850 [Vibrio rotiferianus]|uniref:hypothetical protein n=1 Tax=Vibrio rotiferianus TaxID=190895 RepID=UPI00406A8F3C